MNCPKCGQPLAEGVKFCPMCGLDLSTVPAPAPEPEVKKTFCAGCGARIDADLKFCPACGTPVPAPAPAPAPAPEPAPAGTELTKPKKKTKKKWFIIAGCAVVAIAVAVVLIIMLGGDKGGASSPEKLAEDFTEIYLYVGYGNTDTDKLNDIFSLCATPMLRETCTEYGIQGAATMSRREMKEKLVPFVKQNMELRGGETQITNCRITDVYADYSWNGSSKVNNGNYGDFTESELASIEGYAKVKVAVEYSYQGETRNDYFSIYAIKMDGRWYVLDL